MSAAAQRYAQALTEIASGQDRVRIDGSWLFDEFLHRHPFLDPLTRRDDFLRALRQLEANDGWRLPKDNKAWRHDAKPALPLWVQRPAAAAGVNDREAIRTRFATYSWTPPMQFVPNLASLPDWEEAVAVDRFFRRPDWERCPPVPAKERSWELFGDGGEKRLEVIARGPSWFERGGLTLERLRCFRVPRLPVHADFSGERLVGIIISENEAGFSSFCRLAREGHGFRCVVLGDGNAVLRVAEFLILRASELQTKEIWYLGDVDRDGLRIAHSLGEMLALEGLTLRPWLPGYVALLQDEVSTIAASDLRSESLGNVSKAVDWFPESLREPARAMLLADGHRAQEQVGWEFLIRHYKIGSMDQLSGS